MQVINPRYNRDNFNNNRAERLELNCCIQVIEYTKEEFGLFNYTIGNMDQFIHLREWRVIICKKCQYAVLPSEIDTHFRKSPIHALSKRDRIYIASQVTKINGLIHNEKQLKHEFVFPPSTILPIAALQEPQTNGFRCRFTVGGEQCRYISCSIRKIQTHCQQIHQWINSQKGRPRRVQGESDVPWTTGAHCQRFFNHRACSGYFEVSKTTASTTIETPEEEAQKQLEAAVERVQEKERRIIEVRDKAQEPNPWLRKVKWDEYLEGLDSQELRGLIRPLEDGEDVLDMIHQSFDRVIDSSTKHAVEMVVGEQVLLKVNSIEYGRVHDKPFYIDMKDDTNSRYREIWKGILSFVVRLEEKAESESQLGPESELESESESEPVSRPEPAKQETPHYQLTRAQERIFKRLKESATGFVGVEVGQKMSKSTKKQMQELDDWCLDFCIQLLDHRLTGNPYDSAIIGALAIYGIKEGGGWLEAIEYTTKYSAVIKLARAMVIEKGHRRWQKNIDASVEGGMEEKDAIEANESHYQLVKPMVEKFMGLEGGLREPTPMDWIVRKRTYGMAIRYSTTADGRVDWIGETIIYGSVEFSMMQLIHMVQELAAEARMILMRDLMYIPLDCNGDINEGQVPYMEWKALRDNLTEDKMQWSFLDDPRNPFPVKGKSWLMNRILTEPYLREQYMESIKPLRWRRVMKQYERQLVYFQELLLVLCHLTGGMPSRAPEILSVRHRNTASGGFRNIVVEDGLIAYVPRTGKNYMATGKTKIIHHYLPREVGELMLYYLWLVLPFWEQVCVSVGGEDIKLSPFVWGQPEGYEKEEDKDEGGDGSEGDDSKEDRNEGDGNEGDGNEGDNSQGDNSERLDDNDHVYHQVGPWYNKWTSARMREIIKRESRKAMGEKGQFHISAWRNMIRAIGVRFLHRPFQFDEDEEWKDESDEIWDEQFSHGGQMGEMMYGRLLSEMPGEGASQKAKFRHISQLWHRFLHFPSVWNPSSRIGIHDQLLQQGQIQRRIQMRSIDVQVALEQYMGSGTQFRSVQKAAVQAIMNGEGPILIVMGTGAGKSLMFMLPAFCSPEGTTIVVVPLVSLQQNLKDRCKRTGISCCIWDSQRPRQGQSTSIVLVTPEAVFTKRFREFINRLKSTHQLDRIVYDEAHTALQSRADFRPQMRHLGGLSCNGVQTVFMTATLRPREEEQFCQLMNIIGVGRRKFRGVTSRPNIRYEVRQYEKQKADDTVEAIYQVVEEMKLKYTAPAKIIEYSDDITQAETLSRALDCMLYHAKVDSKKGKQERLEKWCQGEEEHRVAVATNALGLGIDIGDIRAVVHGQKPRNLADYVQESGRAGRDGAASQAIIMLPVAARAVQRRGTNRRTVGPVERQEWEAISYKHKGEHTSWEEREIQMEMDEFIKGPCRRVVLDRVMDGRTDRVECEPDEEVCDLCQERREQEHRREEREAMLEMFHEQAEERTDSSRPKPLSHTKVLTESRINISPGVQISITVNNIHEQLEIAKQDREQSWIRKQVQSRQQEERANVAVWEQWLRRLVGVCPWCYINQQGYWSGHSIKNCTVVGASTVRQNCERFVETAEKKRLMERFGCCFQCFAPQAICERWEQKEEGGRWVENRVGKCQLSGIFVAAFYSIWLRGGDLVTERIREWGEQEGVDITDDESVIWWLGRKVEYGGMEMNRMAQIMQILVQED